MAASTAQSSPLSGPVPRGERRRREIAAVAERVFFETGFSDTTMQAIAARAGASKETLYRHFGSKEDLFAEIVAGRARSFLEDLDDKFDRPRSVADVLGALGFKLLESMTGQQGISLCRIVIAESPRNPELGAIFFSYGPNRVHERLVEFLVAANERGELHCADPDCAARLFLGAVVANYNLMQLVLHETPLTAARMRAHVDEAVALFMGRYASGACRT